MPLSNEWRSTIIWGAGENGTLVQKDAAELAQKAWEAGSTGSGWLDPHAEQLRKHLMLGYKLSYLPSLGAVLGACSSSPAPIYLQRPKYIQLFK